MHTRARACVCFVIEGGGCQNCSLCWPKIRFMCSDRGADLEEKSIHSRFESLRVDFMVLPKNKQKRPKFDADFKLIFWPNMNFVVKRSSTQNNNRQQIQQRKNVLWFDFVLSKKFRNLRHFGLIKSILSTH